MHGGLFAQDNVILDDLRNIERNRQPPEEGLMCDLLVSTVHSNSNLFIIHALYLFYQRIIY